MVPTNVGLRRRMVITSVIVASSNLSIEHGASNQREASRRNAELNMRRGITERETRQGLCAYARGAVYTRG